MRTENELMEIVMQLHCGGGGGGSSAQQIKQSAPGSTQAATIDGATKDERERIMEQLKKGRGKAFTNKQGQQSALENMKKHLMGE